MLGYPEILEIDNVTARAKDKLLRNSALYRHTDQAYDADPATTTMLYARKEPKLGGETLVADMKAAYDELDAATKQKIDGMMAKHLYGATSGRGGEEPARALNKAQASGTPPPLHPLVRPHTVTGQKTLYGIDGTAYGIEGMQWMTRAD